MHLTKLALAATLATLGSTASAAVTTYTDLASWTAGTSGPVTLEDFNSFTGDDPAPFDAGDFMVSAVGAYAADNGIEAYDPNPTDIQSVGQDRNIDGTTYFSADVDNTVITFVFDFVINGISWDQTSVDSAVDITFDGQMANLGDGGFFGLTSDTGVTSFTLSGTDGAFGLDNIRYSVAAVPVPAALPLLALGLAGLGYAGRRRRD